MNSPQKFLMLPNNTKTEAVRFACELTDFLNAAGKEVYVMRESGVCLGDSATAVSAENAGNMDICIVLGGDGTVLRAVRLQGGMDIPILGINFGHLGYLTECEPNEAIECLERVMSNDYRVEEREMLSGSLIRNGKAIALFTALNEVVVSRGAFARPLSMRLELNSNPMGDVAADGILVSTPTGSTAYNLSAGGPVVPPCSDSFIMTPICARSMPHCSIVTASSDIIDISVLPNDDIDEFGETGVLSVDSLEQHSVFPCDCVHMTRSERHVKLIKIKDESFYSILQKKLAQ